MSGILKTIGLSPKAIRDIEEKGIDKWYLDASQGGSDEDYRKIATYAFRFGMDVIIERVKTTQ
jgi:hypothetical protein